MFAAKAIDTSDKAAFYRDLATQLKALLPVVSKPNHQGEWCIRLKLLCQAALG